MSKNDHNHQKEPSSWWGDYVLPVGGSLCWQLGFLDLSVMRCEKEWQICHSRPDFDQEPEEKWTLVEKNSCEMESGELQRHAFTHTDEQLNIVPLLADRSVVIKSAVPLHIQVGQQVTLYVSTPLWMDVQVHAQRISLQELPIVRPSDTWFGASTMEGDLCYASMTQGRLYLQDLPPRFHRAISPVLIQNESSKPLLLQRLSLPVPYLSLFETREYGLWTEAITMKSDDDTDLAKVSVAGAPPEPYAEARKISGPREEAGNNMLVRTFSALFG